MVPADLNFGPITVCSLWRTRIREDPDGEYSLLMFATMVTGTALVWFARIGAWLYLPLWQLTSWSSPNYWLEWASGATSFLVVCLWTVFRTWSLSWREHFLAIRGRNKGNLGDQRAVVLGLMRPKFAGPQVQRAVIPVDQIVVSV